MNKFKIVEEEGHIYIEIVNDVNKFMSIRIKLSKKEIEDLYGSLKKFI
tara:strand:+ start:2009 stop:2152 length:144 start_codon:yes stop_codon:yes gene_type:complete